MVRSVVSTRESTEACELCCHVIESIVVLPASVTA